LIERDAMLAVLQQIAALKRYDPNQSLHERPSTRSTTTCRWACLN
jgi:hypothetical protein